MSKLKPDEAYCKKCGAPVRFGNVNTGKAYTVGIALDAEKVPHGAYDLVEHETEEGLATGKWLAIYVRAAERNNRKRYRPHSCDPEKVARIEAIRMGRA